MVILFESEQRKSATERQVGGIRSVSVAALCNMINQCPSSKSSSLNYLCLCLFW